MDEGKLMWAALIGGVIMMISGVACGLFFSMGTEEVGEGAPALLAERAFMRCPYLVERLGEPLDFDVRDVQSGETTQLEIRVKGTDAAGDYSFSTRPSKDSWTVVSATFVVEGDRMDVVSCLAIP